MRNFCLSNKVARTALFTVVMGCSSAAPDAAPAPQVGKVQQAASGEFYELPFGPQTSNFLPPKTVILTFDDGPDWPEDDSISDPNKGNTGKILDILKAKKVSATFFINRENYSDIDKEPEMANMVRRMVREGHELASHGWHHWSIGLPHADIEGSPSEITEDVVETELAGVEQVVDKIFGKGKFRMTLFRAPFGEPFQSQSGAVDVAKDVVSQHAVHIGWNVDAFDYSCGFGTCAFDNVRTALQSGANGVILLHSVQAQEVDSLPETIDWLKDNGYQFWSVEQAVCAKYGKYSKDLIDGTGGSCNPEDRTTKPHPEIPDDPAGGDGDTGDGDGGDGDAGDGDTGDGDTGDGDGGDGDTGDGDIGDGDTGEGDTGDGDGGDGDTGDGDSGDGDTGDGDTGDGDTGDGDTGDGDNGDGDFGDGDTGDGDNGDGDTGDGDGGDGEDGDGDSGDGDNGDGDEDSGDGEGDGDGDDDEPGLISTPETSCSVVRPGLPSGAAGWMAIGLGSALVVRRRRRRKLTNNE